MILDHRSPQQGIIPTNLGAIERLKLRNIFAAERRASEEKVRKTT